jgi:hypothetical protein
MGETALTDMGQGASRGGRSRSTTPIVPTGDIAVIWHLQDLPITEDDREEGGSTRPRTGRVADFAMMEAGFDGVRRRCRFRDHARTTFGSRRDQ